MNLSHHAESHGNDRWMMRTIYAIVLVIEQTSQAVRAKFGGNWNNFQHHESTARQQNFRLDS